MNQKKSKQKLKSSVTKQRRIEAAERDPRYEPFENRTPLVCDNGEEFGSICNPCGKRCEVGDYCSNYYCALGCADGAVEDRLEVREGHTAGVALRTSFTKNTALYLHVQDQVIYCDPWFQLITLRRSMSIESTSTFVIRLGKSTTSTLNLRVETQVFTTQLDQLLHRST